MIRQSYVVYVATNIASGKVYVGKAHNLTRRRAHHAYQARSGHQTLFHRAIRKYGMDGFKWQAIAGFRDEADALQFERETIAMLRANDPARGYNLTLGGEGPSGYKATPEAIEKMRAAKLGTKMSADSKLRMHWAATRRRNSGPRDVLCSETECHIDIDSARELIPKAISFWKNVAMSAAKRGKAQPAEAELRRTALLRGKKRTPEQCATLSEAATKRVRERPELMTAAWQKSVDVRRGQPAIKRRITEGWEERDGVWFKPCKRCNSMLTLDHFGMRGATPRNHCKPCRVDEIREYQARRLVDRGSQQ